MKHTKSHKQPSHNGEAFARRSEPMLKHLFQATRIRQLLATLQETEHFCRWREEKVAKIVPYGLPEKIGTDRANV
jgi:hypothetical protein